MLAEKYKKLWALFAGMIFGVGWLVFIGVTSNYTRCYNAPMVEDPCHWGFSSRYYAAQQNHTVINDTIYFNISSGSVGELGGWKPLTDELGIVALPGMIALVSLFMVNTVELADIKEDSRLSSGGVLCLRVWLFVGFVLGFSAVAACIAIHVIKFTNQTHVKSGDVGVAAIVQVSLIILSTMTFWVARTIPSEP